MTTKFSLTGLASWSSSSFQTYDTIYYLTLYVCLTLHTVLTL